MVRANAALPVILAALVASRTASAQQAPPEAGPAAVSAAPAPEAPKRPAPAVTPSELVLQARQALEDQRYDEALSGVRSLLGAEPRWRAPALEITAVALLILGQATEAKSALSKLYELSPAFTLRDPSLPPRVTSAFTAEATEPHPRAVMLQLRPDLVDRQGFDLVAGGDTTSVHLACRRDALDPYLPFSTTTKDGLHHFRVPTGHTYQCFAVALDKDDLPLGRLGHEAAPFSAVPRAKAPETPVYQRWWFWTTILGAAAATGVTVGFVVQKATIPPTAPAADITVHAQPTLFRW